MGSVTVWPPNWVEKEHSFDGSGGSQNEIISASTTQLEVLKTLLHEAMITEVTIRSGEDGACPPERTSVRILPQQNPARVIARAIAKSENHTEAVPCRDLVSSSGNRCSSKAAISTDMCIK